MGNFVNSTVMFTIMKYVYRLITVIIIIAIGLVIKFITSYEADRDVDRFLKVQHDFNLLSELMDEFYKNKSFYPKEIRDLKVNKILMHDPWQNEYRIEVNNNKYLLYTYGSDNRPGGKEFAQDLNSDTDFEAIIKTYRENNKI